MLLQNFLENSASRLPDKTALICGDRRLTYGQINDQADQLACFLREQGIQRQDRVAIFLDNSVESVISLFAILKADAIFLMLSSAMKAGKLAYILNDCRVKALITHTSKSSVVEKALCQAPTVEKVLWVGSNVYLNLQVSSRRFQGDFLSSSDDLAPSPSASGFSSPQADDNPQVAGREIQGDPAVNLTLGCTLSATSTPHPSGNIDLDLAAIIYTSGSTGHPKGVMLTHLNMVSAATSITSYLENVEDDIILNCLPLSFDYGLYQVIMAFKFGGTIVLERSFTFSYHVIEKMIKEKATGFPLVPTILAILLGLRGWEKLDFTNLRYITNTAAALPPTHIAKLRKTFPHVRIFSMYGLTECKRVSFLPPEEIDRRPTSIGKGMPNEEVWIVDEQGNRVGPEVTGELVVRGSNVMRGYWGLPEETARTLRPGKHEGEKVLYTGDFFKMDEEGFLYFIGRKDDIFKSRGELISPKEIENCLSTMEGIAEAVVFGVPDEVLGQAIVAYLRCSNEHNITVNQVVKHCYNNLEYFMVPKYVKFLSSFPFTSTGKIDKLKLKALALGKE
jgi:long-chain acyl-CoA synthetase